jgi:hypothetical protein
MSNLIGCFYTGLKAANSAWFALVHMQTCLVDKEYPDNVSRARAVLCYVWMHYLGQSGRVLAEKLGVSSQAVYAASSRVERNGGLDAEVLERWCR